MAVDSTQLASELTNDPAALGYAAAVSDQAKADVINTRSSARLVFEPSISAAQFQAALDPTEFTTLTATELTQLSIFLAGGVLNVGIASVRSILNNLFPSATRPTTRANLLAIIRRNGSRAEQLWGTDTLITHINVAVALGRGTP